MSQAISNIFGDGKGGRDENSYQETKRRVAVEGRRGSDGTQQNVPILNSPRLSASSSTVVQSSQRVAIVQECGQIGGTQQNVPKSLHPQLKSSSNTRLSTCPTEVEDSSRIRVVEESGGTRQSILKNLQSELESSSKTWIPTCSSKVKDSSRIRVVATTCGSRGTQQNILKSLQFELEPSSNIRPSTCSSKVEDSSKIKVVEESSGSGGTQQNIPKSLQSELESSSNTRLYTCSSKVGDSSRIKVVEESGGSGGAQQNVPKSSKRKCLSKKERMHSSSNDTRLSASSSTEVVETNISVAIAQECGQTGGTRQNVPKSLHRELKLSNDTKISTCPKVVNSSKRVVEESGDSGGTHQNILKSLESKFESSSNTRLSTCSSKVEDSSRIRVVEESGESGCTQQNVPKNSRRKRPSKKERMQSSGNDTRQSTSSSTKVVVSSKMVVEKSDGNGGTQQNVPKRSRRKPRGKEILHSSNNATLSTSNKSTEDRVISILKHEETMDKLLAKWSQVVVKEDKQIKHYRSSHKILLVGEGDFSFSACLAKAFGSAANMVATSLDSIEFLELNYGKAISNIYELKKRGCMVMHGFDVHNMANRLSVKGMKFDRIIYNFPLVGFFHDKPRVYQLRRNKILMQSFFKNAKLMLSKEGEIHVSHKCNSFFRNWDLETLAWENGLQLMEEAPFQLNHYPGYNTKYGFGGDANFNCNPSKTYKFVVDYQASKSFDAGGSESDEAELSDSTLLALRYHELTDQRKDSRKS